MDSGDPEVRNDLPLVEALKAYDALPMSEKTTITHQSPAYCYAKGWIAALNVAQAAHRAEVERAVAEERDACLKSCRDVIGAINHDGECPMLIVHAYEVHGAEKCIAEIRARGVAKPRTGSEAPSASDEGAKS